jgi:O-glycosyl hydrolase
MKKSILLSALLFLAVPLFAQYPVIKGVNIQVKFDQEIRTWDGFGFNYVETAQTPNYKEFQQEYGGFSLLDNDEKSEIIDLVFGEEGLKVGLIKMFCDPFHQTEPGGAYDHETTTRNMREFVRKGLARTRSWGGDLEIITTLYGPPAYMTLQKVIRGRDLNPLYKEDLADYLVSWVRYLRDEERFPVKYVSLHNEGEDWERWPLDGSDPNIGHGHDYNMYWRPELVAEMMILTDKKLKEAGVEDVGVTPGETTNWYRFSYWGYADTIAENNEAMKAIGLITSHGFYVGSYENRWFGDHNCMGTELIRTKKPGLHAWVTSTSWGKMDTKNIKEMHDNIYSARVNGIIPWAGIQRPVQWIGGDPNPGSAFTVHEDGTFEIRRGYYFYKQLTRPGQPGTVICRTLSNDTEVPVIAFAKGTSKGTDAFVVTNLNTKLNKSLIIRITGTKSKKFRAFRTKEDETEKYSETGTFEIVDGELSYNAPAGSVTTFFAE